MDVFWARYMIPAGEGQRFNAGNLPTQTAGPIVDAIAHARLTL